MCTGFGVGGGGGGGKPKILAVKIFKRHGPKIKKKCQKGVIFVKNGVFLKNLARKAQKFGLFQKKKSKKLVFLPPWARNFF